MNRRELLILLTGTPVALAGCAPAQISQVVTDANAIANGLAGILPSIQTITGLAGGALNTVNNAISSIKNAASTLQTATGGVAVTAANAIQTGLAVISSALGSFKVPSWVQIVLTAAQTVVPVIMSAVGALTPLGATAPTGMTVAQARAILQAAASGAAAHIGGQLAAAAL